MDWQAPFALMRDADGGWLLFCRPRAVHSGRGGLHAGLAFLSAALSAGDHVAGGIGYAAGFDLEPRLAGLARGEAPVWLGRFGPPDRLDDAGLAALLAGAAGPSRVGEARPRIARDTWLTAVADAQALIGAGDIYQANLGFLSDVAVAGHPAALFARLLSGHPAPHAALVHRGGGRWWLSSSPELFFEMDAEGTILARPMKGTAARAPDPAADARVAETLRLDTKNRAENLMITDLIRHDLARVTTPASVRVPALFTVETHGSVHQMTSTVVGQLQPGADCAAVLGALFPCGSITGAPKIRAIEVIAGLEREPRGIWCGALGWAAPGGAARWSVAIRTLEIEGGAARLGVGAGIVADSVGAEEWRECLAKTRFLGRAGPDTLIETMRSEGDGRIVRLERHLDRLERSAAFFGFGGHRDVWRTAARKAAIQPGRLRLLVGRNGGAVTQLGAIGLALKGPWRVAIVPLPVMPDDWRLRHKTGDRAFYDEARRGAGTDEVLFERPDGQLTEGSFTSLFVERDGRLLTPRLDRGLLPGVLRAELLEQGIACEADLVADDLAGGFYLGNSLRGLVPARLVDGGRPA